MKQGDIGNSFIQKNKVQLFRLTLKHATESNITQHQHTFIELSLYLYHNLPPHSIPFNMSTISISHHHHSDQKFRKKRNVLSYSPFTSPLFETQFSTSKTSYRTQYSVELYHNFHCSVFLTWKHVVENMRWKERLTCYCFNTGLFFCTTLLMSCFYQVCSVSLLLLQQKKTKWMNKKYLNNIAESLSSFTIQRLFHYQSNWGTFLRNIELNSIYE